MKWDSPGHPVVKMQCSQAGAQVRSLAGELRVPMMQGAAKKEGEKMK